MEKFVHLMKKKLQNFRDIVLCPYEDEQLAAWIKLVFGMIWAISIPNGLIYGASMEYQIALMIMVGVLVLDMWIGRKHRSMWLDTVVFMLLCLPVFFVYYHALIGSFSVMFLLIYACGIVFVLGIGRSIVINLAYLLAIFIGFRWNADSPVRELYGENIALRFPYLFVCMVLMAYSLMYTIQKYWVNKRRRTQILEKRIAEERQQLDTISVKVMDSMVHALGAKIPGEEEHYLGVAAFAREIALREGMDEQQCADAYSAGLLHEIGMIGIPDALIRREDLSDEEYKVFQTYVQKGYQIITTLHSTGRSEIADAVHYHREAYDGNGFLEGLAGEEIPKLARVLAVADYADRHLRRGESPMLVARLILEQQNRLFEPQSARIMAQMLQEHEISIVHK